MENKIYSLDKITKDAKTLFTTMRNKDITFLTNHVVTVEILKAAECYILHVYFRVCEGNCLPTHIYSESYDKYDYDMTDVEDKIMYAYERAL